MNNRQIITLIVVAVAALVGGYFIGAGMNGIRSEGQITMKNQSDSLNYFLGLSLGYDLGGAPWDANAGLIASGMNQVLSDSSVFDQMTAQAVFRQLNISLSEIEAMEAESASMENLEKGITFLEENGKKEGVTTTETGLQYEIVTDGNGPKPTDTSTVTVFYEGTLIDGTVFDSSYETGDSVSFSLNGVILGWTEGLQLMPVGSIYKFYIPSNLAYGPRETGPIPGNSALIFKIELLGIE
ncbi:MAG: FKBP-type peptidyl-prolyl cis-trans isomerase [Bacteroidales bacterium]|nr:FKBP-type peptidyl-prolyl cis-trans isomerase [Bacteroidales bacterium]